MGVAALSPENNPKDDLERWLRIEVVEAAQQLDAGIGNSLTVDEVRQHFVEKRAEEEGDRG